MEETEGGVEEDFRRRGTASAAFAIYTRKSEIVRDVLNVAVLGKAKKDSETALSDSVDRNILQTRM